jgi:TatD DNase family protein
MNFFDTHTHVNFAGFKDDSNEVIQRALDQNIWLTNVGTQANTSKAAVEMAAKYEKGVFAAIGLHPIHTHQQVVDEEEDHFQSHGDSFDENLFTSMLTDKVVAVGECGLDYFRLPAEGREAAIAKQKVEFAKQLQFAKQHKLPVIIHCRDAYADVLEILKAEYDGLPGVIHSFTDTWDTAKKFLDFGFYVALNGILTFDKTGKLSEVVENTPLEMLLTETDAPYLTPPPFRGKRNEPSYVQYVAQHMAKLKKTDLETVAAQTFQNATKLFQIKSRPA